MKNINIRKKLASLLMAGTTIVLSACSNCDEYEPAQIVGEPIVYEDTKEELIEETEKIVVGEKPVIEEDKDGIEYNTRPETVVFIKNTTYVYTEEDTASEKYGKVLEGRNYRYVDEDEDWYQVDYYGMYGYVSKEDSFMTYKTVMKYPMIDKGYLVDEKIIYADKELTYELETLPELEFVEIYKEIEDKGVYLVATTDNIIGYMTNDNICYVEGNMAVVDRSNQEMFLYDGNAKVLTAPVVTGTKGTENESDLGFFTIFKERHNLYITDTAYVNNMLNYNRGEGIHDAVRWRKTEEFGGDTYLTNGSHGCINNLSYAADYASEILDVGDKVLVKE